MPPTDIEQSETDQIVDLANLGGLGLDFVPAQAVESAEAVAVSTAFLPRLQVNNGLSALVAEGKAGIGTLALVYTKEKFVDLGKGVAVLALSVRAKALLMPDGGSPIAYYDQKSDDFVKVQKKAEEGTMNGNMFGPEFLIWIPSQNTFATFYFSSDSMRRVAPQLLQIMKKDPNNGAAGLQPAAAKIAPEMVKGKKHTWWVVSCNSESTPLPTPQPGFVKRLKLELEKFNNPPVSEVEQDEAADTSRAR